MSDSVMQEAPQESVDHLRQPETRLVITHAPESPTWVSARNIEAQVFIDCKYVTTPEELENEYKPYVDKSFMLLAEVDGEPQGAIRFVTYDPEVSFKTLKDLDTGRLELDEQGKEILDKIHPSKMFEIGTIAVNKDFRATPTAEFKLIGQLYGSIFEHAKANDTPYVIASFDEDYYNRFIKMCGPAALQLGPAMDYMGSPTVPALIDTYKAYEHFHTIPGLEGLIADIDSVAGRIEQEPVTPPAQ